MSNSKIFIEACGLITNTIKKHLKSNSDFKASEKINIHNKNEVVTELDLYIDRIVTHVLNKKFPSVFVLSEENYKKNKNPVDLDDFFVLDPIDGTKDFVKGGNLWAVSLARIKNKKVTSAYLFFPKKKEVYITTESKVNLLNGRKLKNYKKNTTKNKLVGISPKHLKRFNENKSFKTKIIPSFTGKIRALLQGEINYAIFLKEKKCGMKIWDYAASALIFEKSGGKVVSLNNELLNYESNKIIHSDGWIASYNKNILSVLNKVKNL